MFATAAELERAYRDSRKRLCGLLTELLPLNRSSARACELRRLITEAAEEKARLSDEWMEAEKREHVVETRLRATGGG